MQHAFPCAKESFFQLSDGELFFFLPEITATMRILIVVAALAAAAQAQSSCTGHADCGAGTYCDSCKS